MRKKTGLIFLVSVLAVLMLMGLTHAVSIDKAEAIVGSNTTVNHSRNGTETAAGSHSAEGGNVTNMNLSSQANTVKWAGYYGSVSASLRLGSSADVLYDFGAVPNYQIKSVIATVDQSFDFSALQNATPSGMDTAYGFTGNDADSGLSTYDNHTNFGNLSKVASVNLNAFNNGTGSTNGTLDTNLYNSTLLSDSASPTTEFDYAFGVRVVANQFAYDNGTGVDYELIVPTNTSGLAGTQTYYFWMDIE